MLDVLEGREDRGLGLLLSREGLDLLLQHLLLGKGLGSCNLVSRVEVIDLLIKCD